MASKFWTGGANNGTWNDNNNWATSEGGASGAAFPDDTDDVYVQATNQSINGLATGKAFASLTISFGGSIGTAGTPLTFTCTGPVTIRTSNGTHYLGATAAGTVVTVKVQKTGTGKVYLTGPGAYTTVYTAPATSVDISSSAAVTTLESAGITDAANNSTDFTTLIVNGGTTSSFRPATTVHASNCNLFMKGVDAAITTLNCWSGGKHYHFSSSTITTSNVYAGGFATG